MKIKWSEERNELACALAKAQGEIKTASKDNVARVQTKKGGQYSYRYSTLDDIWTVTRKPLSDNGLSIIQIPANDEGGFYLETTLLHSSGQWVSGTMSLPVVSDRMSTLQAMGSAITYARRYALGAMVGVTTGDDDDGQTAGSNIEIKTRQATTPPPPPINGQIEEPDPDSDQWLPDIDEFKMKVETDFQRLWEQITVDLKEKCGFESFKSSQGTDMYNSLVKLYTPSSQDDTRQ